MIRVILADGSAVIRSVEKQIFSDDKEFSVVAVCYTDARTGALFFLQFLCFLPIN